jgi:ketosteroid isomerase-like protein
VTWLVESPWPTLMLGLAVEVGLAIWLIRSGRVAAIAAMGIVLAATVGLLVVERLVVTDAEAVEDALADAAAALEANDPPRVLALFAPDSPRLAEVRSILSRMTVRDARVGGDLEIRFDDKAQTANTTFTARVEARDNQGQLPHEHFIRRLSVTLHRQGDRWLIYDYADSDPRGPGGKGSSGIPRR